MSVLGRKRDVLSHRRRAARSMAALGVGQAALERAAAARASDTVQAPRFEVDPLWPKPLPNHWLLGSAIGVCVDAQDHVCIIHRGPTPQQAHRAGAAETPPIGECCLAAPPVLEFDPEGNLVATGAARAQGYEWPDSNHGITVDHKDNVWIGGNGAEGRARPEVHARSASSCCSSASRA